ncbi:MAG: glutamate synthase subunit alpha, partial [Clostridia bacterium]|nr:glutamate synthase subunit alpha [Clostridia bacterium]
MKNETLQNNLLYSEQFEHDACGIGTVVSIKGEASRRIVDSALKIVEKLEHRAGKDAAGETGDGVGIIVATPHEFFKAKAAECGIELGDAREYGIGMLFLPQDKLRRAQAKKMLEIITAKEGLRFLGWRVVPTCPETLGQNAIDKMPYIEQCFIEKPADCAKGIDFDRRLYVVRRVFEQSNDNTYVCSLSSRTIVYKGMFLVQQLRSFYRDLQEEDFVSSIAMVHSRFSTNTNPSWERAHPNRFIVHNGEINTIRGNADRMLARGETMESPFLNENYEKILPVVDTAGSDSAMLDNTLEFLVMNGMDLP